MTKPAIKAKPKRKKQHDVRGASFIRLAKRLQAVAYQIEGHRSIHPYLVVEMIADAIKAEGEATRKLR